MTIYAKINSENIVENVILCEDSEISSQNGLHIKVTNLTNDAIIGAEYDEINNKFISPKPYESWILNSDFVWESPEGPRPSEGSFKWDEESLSWVELIPSE